MPTSTAINTTQGAGSRAARVAINAAFLQEIKDINAALDRDVHRLERLSHCPSVIRNHALAFVGQLESFRDDLAMHFALEEFFGYLDDPLEVEPRLCEQADKLQGEHSVMYRQLCGLVEAAQSLLERHQVARMASTIPPPSTTTSGASR